MAEFDGTQMTHEELLAYHQQRLEAFRAKEIELKNKMGDIRRPKITDQQNPDGTYVQKGLSGEEMMQKAESEVGDTLENIQEQIRQEESAISGLGVVANPNHEVRWFRRAYHLDTPKHEVSPVHNEAKPVVPKVKVNRVPKKPFHGPKSPSGYKRKLYIPQKFVHAANVWDSMPSGNATPTIDPEEGNEEGQEDSSVIVSDPVVEALWTIPSNIKSIKWMVNPASAKPCSHCLTMGAHPAWSSVEEFVSQRASMIKAGDDKHMAHPNCSCYLEVDTDNGKYTVDYAGQTRKLSK